MVVVGPETFARIEGRYATRDLGRKQLKNVKGEVPVKQVLGRNP
jgi:hypothetical protein